MSRHVVWGIVLVLMGILTAVGYWALLFPSSQSGAHVGVPAGRVADYARSVIEAHRAVYTTEVSARASSSGSGNGVLRPEQLLIASGRLAEAQGISYRLASLAPVNERNAPRTEFERRGLEAVKRNPAKPYVGAVKRNGHEYFQAIYPDVARSQSCVACHNELASHAESPYKVGDVLGGLIVTIPLDH